MTRGRLLENHVNYGFSSFKIMILIYIRTKANKSPKVQKQEMLGITVDWNIYSVWWLGPAALGAPKGRAHPHLTKILRN